LFRVSSPPSSESSWSGAKSQRGPALVGELSTRSAEFRTWWAAHNVRYHQTGTKRIPHPIAGEMELSYEVMELAADDEMTISVYSAEPGSRSQQALNLLASWAATPIPINDTDGARLGTPPT
jgi:hypothetical protein